MAQQAKEVKGGGKRCSTWNNRRCVVVEGEGEMFHVEQSALRGAGGEGEMFHVEQSAPRSSLDRNDCRHLNAGAGMVRGTDGRKVFRGRT